MGDFFRDPAWNSIGVIVAILSLAATVYFGAYRPAARTTQRRVRAAPPIAAGDLPLTPPATQVTGLRRALGPFFVFVPSFLFGALASLLAGAYGVLKTGHFTIFFHNRPVTVLAILLTNAWTFWQLGQWLAVMNNGGDAPGGVRVAELLVAGLSAIVVYLALGAFMGWVLAPAG